MVAEVFLGVFLELLLDRLTRLNLASLHGVDKKLKKWSSALSAIGAVLQDAEEKQLTTEAVKLWLDELKHLAYDMEDIMDTFSTELLRRKVISEGLTTKVRGLLRRAMFNFDMNSEIKKISDRLQEISDKKDSLGLNYVVNFTKTWQRPPSSCVLDGPVVGRDGDKRKIVEVLLKDEPSSVNFHVVAIVGMPGLGKTTLAGHVFGDDEMERFSPRVWVSVSDNFNLVRVTKAILESVTSVHSDLEEFSQIQDCLSKELASKKFLVVLDDVWNTCDYDLWTKLQSSFRRGALGSKVIVTTRDTQVAKMMRAIEVHNLESMPDDDCWKVFGQHAFLNIDKGRLPSFELFREKVVAKCGGLPLAARVLGGLLGCKELDEWEEILNSKLWSLCDNSGILPVLKLSYHYLSSNLKRCFAYCSILPNDYEFGERQLILLWMAEGLIQQSQECKQLEDLGSNYFRELLSRSLFQRSSDNHSQYVMHDLVGDLARWAAGHMCFRLEDKLDARCSLKVRHSSYISGHFDGVQKFKEFFEVKHLRTFLPLSVSGRTNIYLTRNVTFDLLPKLKYLRSLSLNGYQITELPNSIGKLKHLRYLDLSHTNITSLPESTSNLYNLQTLILEKCALLKALPADMRNLTNLRHLNNPDVPSLEGMPVQLGRLTNLQTLCNYVVRKDSKSGISEIGPLLCLRGTLCLSRLENVTDVEDARRADLTSKEGIDALQLEWRGSGERESDVFDMLKPHRKLKELTVKGYGGLTFSTWSGHPLFSNITLVKLENCKNCRFLPSLGQLSALKVLCIRGMSTVESVGLEFYGEGSQPFPVLETLEFKDMPKWREWFPCEQDQRVEVFPCLKVVCISECPKLEGRLPENLDLLSKLSIDRCGQLVVSITSYKQLRDLKIRGCKMVVHTSVVEFELLEAMELSGISEFRLQMEGFKRDLTALKNLTVTSCEELTSLWQNEDSLLQCRISIGNNSHSHFVQELKSLQRLHINDCSSLVSLSEVGLPPSLKEIKIERCRSLKRFQIPPHVRRLYIESCMHLESIVVDYKEGEVPSSSFSACLIQEEASCLEYLSIMSCPSLTSLSSKGQLPRGLKHLCINHCYQLEFITDSFNVNTCLEEIEIRYCGNLKSLPEDLCELTNLQVFKIWDCESLVSFPSRGFSTRPSNLKEIEVMNCDKLEALPKNMHNLPCLQMLRISYCEGFAHFLEEGFPPNLTFLEIRNLDNCRPLLEAQGLHRLTSLKGLDIRGKDPELVSFPPDKEMLLPKSLSVLHIEGFPNLRHLSSKGFQYLSSLENLQVFNCPKLASIPEEGLPLSLAQLHIFFCPELEKRCKQGKGQYWRSIAHIPFIWIKGETGDTFRS